MKLLIVLLLLSTTLCFGQETFQSTKIRNSILILTSQFPQYDSFTFLTYLNRYDTIFLEATPDELYELTNHPNPLVRRSAFHLMLSHATPKAFDLLEKNLSDTTQWFYVQRYSAKAELQTFADEILFHLSALSGWNDNFKFTPTQRNMAWAMIKRREEERKNYFNNHRQ